MSVTFAPHLRLGNYELLVQLASGGMATVSIARHHGAGGFERLVVVKRVHRNLLANREFSNMFRDEARLASSIKHPNVVPVVDVVEAEGELMLVMEYFESQPLSALLEACQAAGSRLPPPVVARIVSDMLAGLHAAHEAVDIRRRRLGIIHRDVSPQNVIVDVDGVSRVIDFGIAKAAVRLTQTKGGLVKGKVGYMSPEQLEALPVDRRADVFAAGVVLHETLTLRRLFDHEDEFEAMRRVLRADVPDVSVAAPDTPPAVDAVVRRALARSADERFQTALEFQDALERALAPSPPRAVAACLTSFCHDALEQRREKLLSLLGEELDKLRSRSLATLPEPPGAVPSGELQAAGVPSRGSRARLAAWAAVVLLVAAAATVASLRRSAKPGAPLAAPSAIVPSSTVATVAPSPSAPPSPSSATVSPPVEPASSPTPGTPVATPVAPSHRRAPSLPRNRTQKGVDELQANPYGP